MQMRHCILKRRVCKASQRLASNLQLLILLTPNLRLTLLLNQQDKMVFMSMI